MLPNAIQNTLPLIRIKFVKSTLNGFRKSSLILILLLLSSCAQRSKDIREMPHPYRLNPITNAISFDISRQNILVVDIDKDGMDEILKFENTLSGVSSAPSYFVITDWSQRRVFCDQENIRGRFLGLNCFNIQGNKEKEIVLFELFDRKVFLNIYGIEEDNPVCLHRLIISDIPLPKTLGKTNFRVIPVNVLDWDGDGSLDLLCVVATTYGYQPRGVWIINFSTGNILLRKQIGPLTDNATPYDLDGDGKNEIIFGGKALYNCEELPDSERFFNGTDDSLSWLFIVDDDGEFLLKNHMSGTGSVASPFVHDMNHDGKPEIIVLVTEGRAGKSSSVAFLGVDTGQRIKVRKRPEQIILAAAFIDWQEDGSDEFLTLWQDGLLEVRDDNNNVVKSLDTGMMAFSKLDVFDFEQDGTAEICLWGDSGLLLLDSKLRPMVYDSLKVRRLEFVSPGSGEKRLFHIVSSGHSVIYELDKNISHALYSPPLAALTFVIGIALTFALVAIIRRKSSGSVFLQEELSPSIIYFLLDTAGKIKECGTNAEPIIPADLPNAKNIPVQRVFASEGWKPIRQIIEQGLSQ